MKGVKGCFDADCNAYKKVIKFKDDDYFCSKCGKKIDYVCRDRKCTNPVPNAAHKRCNSCLAKIAERGAKIPDKTKDYAAAGGAVAGLVGAVIGIVKTVKKK